MINIACKVHQGNILEIKMSSTKLQILAWLSALVSIGLVESSLLDKSNRLKREGYFPVALAIEIEESLRPSDRVGNEGSHRRVKRWHHALGYGEKIVPMGAGYEARRESINPGYVSKWVSDHEGNMRAAKRWGRLPVHHIIKGIVMQYGGNSEGRNRDLNRYNESRNTEDLKSLLEDENDLPESSETPLR